MKGGGLRFTLLTHSSNMDMDWKHGYFNQTLRYCTFSESELEDCTDLHPKMSEFQGIIVKNIPIQYGVFRVDGTLFMVGGCCLQNDLIASEPTNWMWSASPPPPHVASPNVRWTRCPTPMNVKRFISVLVPLRDGRIFICGGTAELESWAEIYDGQFEARKLSDEIGYPHPSSCFQWTDNFLLYTITVGFTAKNYSTAHDLGEDKQHTKPSLLSYNLRTKEWEVIEENLPGPLPHSYNKMKRNLVYVGCDTLFIIDSTYHWFGYNLSSKEVGKVKVEGQSKEDEDEDDYLYALVVGAVYAGYNVSQSTGWVIYIFQLDRDKFETCLRYSKVEVVQCKGGDYVATVGSSGLVTVGFFSYVDIIADREIVNNEVKTNALVGKALLPKKRAREPLLKEKGEEKIDDE